MKVWLIEVMRVAEEEGLNLNPVANIHDEGIFEVLDKDVKRVMEVCEKAFDHVTEHLKLKCPLAGEAKTGPSWLHTH